MVDSGYVETLLGNPRSREEESYPDKAASVSSSDNSNESVSDRDRFLAGIFCVRLFPAWGLDIVLPARPWVDRTGPVGLH